MKREGRKHGMVLTYGNESLPLGSRPNPRKAKQLHQPLTAGLFVKVSNKPTNNSRFTSRCLGRPKCGGCHMNPPSKSKDKVKGTHRTGSSSVCDERSITLQTVRSMPGLKFLGCSGTSMLDYLATEEDTYTDDDDYTDFEES